MTNSTEQHKADLSGLAIDHSLKPRNRKRRWSGLIAVSAVVLGLSTTAAYWYYITTGVNIVKAMTEPPHEVDMLALAAMPSKSGRVVLVANGKIVSDVQVKITTKVSGQITELNVEQGDVVEADQVLARIEDVVYVAWRDESAAMVDSREQDVSRTQAEYRRAQAAIDERKADLDFEQRNYERLEALHEQGQADRFEYLNSKSRFNATIAALNQAIAAEQAAATSINIAQAGLRAAQANLQVSQKRLDDCAIRSPLRGVVLVRNAQIGDFLAAEGGRGANANAQLVEIADLTKMRVEIDVSERDIRRLFANQKARITLDADRSRVYDGHILWVDPVGDYARATVQVKVRIHKPDGALRIQGSAKVEFLAAQPFGAKSIEAPTIRWLPKHAVQLTPGSDVAHVYTVEGGKAVARDVNIGSRTEKDLEILSPLDPGMNIIANIPRDLEDGSAIKIRKTIRLGD